MGATDRVVTSDPAEPKVFLRPNRYEPGRANFVIYNWSRQAIVPVDLSGSVRIWRLVTRCGTCRTFSGRQC